MNRDQKAVAIAEIAERIRESEAVFAVDYQGISVPQAAELRAKLRESDATFQVVKNSLTERAADEAQAQQLKELLQGPTALTYVRGDVAGAAKALADYARATQLLPFKGGLMDGDALAPEQIRAISRLPSRDALYGQLVGIVASPVSGLVRTLGALVGGLAVALGQVQAKKESGELPTGDAPALEAGGEAAQAGETPAAEVSAPETEEVSAPETEDIQAEPAQPADENNQDEADASADRSEIGQQPEDAEATTPQED